MDMINLKNNMLMNKKNSLYEAPTTNILVVRFEGALLTGSPDGTWNNSIKKGSVWNQDEDDYGLE